MPTPAHTYHKKELALGYCLCPIFRAMCSVLNKLTLYLKQKKVKKHGKVQ